MPWQAQGLRLSLFPIPGATLDPLPNIERLTGQAPEETTNRGGRQTEIGRYGRGGLQLVRQAPLRADLLYAVLLGDEEPMPELLALGPVEEHVNAFHKVVQTMLGAAPALQRVAFGAELVRRVQDRDEAYRYIQEKLQGGRLDLGGASEFTYQINRPRESRVLRGVQINRLAKWSASKIVRYMLDSGGQQNVSSETYGNRLTLDINTPGDHSQQLPPDLLLPLFEEFIAFGLEIAAQGDIA